MGENRDEDERRKTMAKKVECCGYPLSILFLVNTEFCERFSFYAMRGVLVFYLMIFLRWDEDVSVSIYHAFLACCYLAPILGAIIADSWLGKFKTIIYLSIVYAVGQVMMTVRATMADANHDGILDNITLHRALAIIGLVLIVLGTGTFRPCLSAFGGDQFGHHQTRQRSIFFSVFFMCTKAGHLVAIFISPMLRIQECGHSQEECYPLDFGVPAALMVVALVVFVVGSRMYVKTAPAGNIMLQVFKCIGFAIKNRYKHRSSQYPKRAHYMDWATEKYDKLLIQQTKMVLNVLVLFTPLTMFWNVLDQASRWSIQATSMDGDFGFIIVNSDQMQILQPILTIILVPVGGCLIYLIEKCGFNFTPLKRIAVGMFLAAMAFISAGIVQLEIDKALPNSVHMALQIPQCFFISAGEALVTVTGLEFSYSQAPSNMKTVLQAGWLLPIAMSFFIGLIVESVNSGIKQWAEYILFASLLLVVCVIFSIKTYFYTYIDPVAIEAEFKRKEGRDSDETDERDENNELEMKEKESCHHDNEEGLKQSKM